jgi:hypothetical protein
MTKKNDQMRAWKIRIFLLRKLPLAFFAGLRLAELTDDSCKISLRHRWINQNPFRSIYFAALLMAAELSTGIIVLREIRRTGRKMSMLIVQMEASFVKKATGKIHFTCSEVSLCSDAVKESFEKDEGVAFSLVSIGTDAQGEKVAEVKFDWSVRPKKA